jgi:hypothetical protein
MLLEHPISARSLFFLLAARVVPPSARSEAAAGITRSIVGSTRTSIEIEQRIFYVTEDGKGEAVRELFA